MRAQRSIYSGKLSARMPLQEGSRSTSPRRPVVRISPASRYNADCCPRASAADSCTSTHSIPRVRVLLRRRRLLETLSARNSTIRPAAAEKERLLRVSRGPWVRALHSQMGTSTAKEK